MNIYLYPAPSKNARFFDEYYSALLNKKDEQIIVRVLQPKNKIGEKIFNFIINRLGHRFPKLPAMAVNYLLRNDKTGVVHFTTQLSVIPDIKNKFIFTYHDVFHMQPQFTGKFFDEKTLNRIDEAYNKAEFIITDSNFSRSILKLYYKELKKNICCAYPCSTKF